jgi:hypothetical protein
VSGRGSSAATWLSEPAVGWLWPAARPPRLSRGTFEPSSGRNTEASPPYDYCEITGTYGRYWNDEEGTHELVEVPFTPVGRRYLDERATARDLAYFVRTRKMWRIRKAVFHGESTPPADELARRFGERVVPLAARDGAAPLGKIGVWTDGKLIVASEVTPGGRRLFVTVRAMRIGATNIRHLSFTF